MRFPCWSEAKRRTVSCWLFTSACLLTAASCLAQAAGTSPNSQMQTTVLSPNGQEAVFDPKMHVVSSVPLPDLWKKMGNVDRVRCRKDGALLFELMPGEQPDMSHEMASIGANGAMLGYFDLRQTPGFEKAAIQQAAFDSAGRIVLLVWNLLATEAMRSDAEGHPHGTRFRMDHTRWVLTVDDNGKILSKFSFKDSFVTGDHFALFKNGNVLVTGFVDESTGGVIFSPDGAVLAKLKVPALEDQQSTASNERSPAPSATSVRAMGSAAGGEAAAAGRRQPMLRGTFVPIASGDDEIFLVNRGNESFLLKVSADATVGPRVKLAIPEDHRAYVERIAGHRAVVSISSAQRLPPGTMTRTPKAVFDTESGALLETLLLSSQEDGLVCYSGSGMKAIRSPEGTLDTLEK